MGDTGSLAIGFALAAMAIQQGWILLLPLVALVFVLETLSVIIQVAYFKASGGRRVFKMAPIHYTFHHEGWSERASRCPSGRPGFLEHWPLSGWRAWSRDWRVGRWARAQRGPGRQTPCTSRRAC